VSGGRGLRSVLQYRWLILAALLLGLAPFGREPHLVEKVRMLFAGDLVRPIDIFDLVLHASPLLLLAVRAGFDLSAGARRPPAGGT